MSSPAPPPRRRPLKAALYCGAFFAADASGNALAYKLRALQRHGIETCAYAPYCDPPYRHVTRLAATPDEARGDVWRADADVHIFEFGWVYPLFELIREVEPPARSIVSFHGVTPREFLPDHARADHERSLAQLKYAREADLVICASAYARDFLVRHGIDEARIRIAPLPVGLPRVRPADRGGRPARLLFVGRMVPSKGMLDLLTALSMLGGRGTGDWELSIVSNPLTSDRAFVEQVRQLADRLKLESRLRLLGKIESRVAMAHLYARSAALVVPTYHETYCLPALEALATGCPVVAYASGAVPSLTRGLAQLVPPGDVTSLASAIGRLIEESAAGRVPIAGGNSVPRREFERRARALAGSLTERRYSRYVVSALREVCGWRPSAMTAIRQAWRTMHGSGLGV